MLLALDVGNTNIVIGFLDESGIRNIARLETDRDKTAHEYAISLRQVIEFSGIAPEDIDGAILSSVVPPINGALIAAVRMITGIRPLVVGPGMKTGLNIALDNPAAMGSDLVVGAAAALAIHAPPLIIIDMGTATTMTVIDREARVLGGAIIPGVGISLEALASGTSQLPHISLDAPKKCISTDTVEAMRSGSVYGTAAMLDGMIARMEAELGEPAAVIATGGKDIPEFSDRDIILFVIFMSCIVLAIVAAFFFAIKYNRATVSPEEREKRKQLSRQKAKENRGVFLLVASAVAITIALVVAGTSLNGASLPTKSVVPLLAVLIPVPASTRAKHRTRYEAFCHRLSADMGVADGYGAITVAYDRAQYKGTHGNEDRTANLEFHSEYFKDKCVLIIDDVITTGSTFLQLRRKLIEHGARFVIGLFLAKTIAFEDERKE